MYLSKKGSAVFVFLFSSLFNSFAWSQSLGGAGTIDGVVTDPSGAAVPAGAVVISNAVSGFRRATKSDANGSFHIAGVPPNTYHLEVTAPSFVTYSQDLTVRTSVPITLKISLAIAGSETSVTVEAESDHLLENVPYAHNDVDRSMLTNLPSGSPGASLSDVIVNTTPGVAADSNGFFHPLGDHAQTTYVIDGQPISDQQSKQFSTQIPANAIQSMELVTGAPSAEFGDKTSLVINAQTRSALGQKAFGSFDVQTASFGTVAENASFGAGNAKFGNFIVVNTIRSGRFLDTPEFHPMHAIGNNETIFDRLDYQPGAKDSFHVNLFGARNWFQVPNTYDEPDQDQRQRVLTYNFAPGYQHTFNAHTLLSVNPFVRHDQVNYYPSANLFADSPATLAQDRRLTNYGVKGDIAYAAGVHNFHAGTQLMQTRVSERFSLGITDPDYSLQPGLIPYDLTRGGTLFRFAGRANINQYAFYVQDSITLGALNINAGLRVDQYNGLSEATGVQPRIGVSYQVKKTGTVLRTAYTRTFETPYNENIVLSSSTGQGGLASNVFGAYGAQPIQPGRRNQFNAGLQQSILKVLLIDADYFWKFTDNAFDFGTLLNTPIQFPISWRKSKIDGVSLRLSTPNIHGFQAFTTMGHTRSRYFGPSNGGIIFNSPLDTGVFRIDHDQAFQQTTHVRYQRPHNGPWAAFTWRYDSGLVAGAVPDLASALALTAAQQAAIGFYCGTQLATVTTPITSCASSLYGSARLKIPAAGTADPDHNPPRIAHRHLFDAAVGTDNLFHTERPRATLRFTALNITNTAALYNFLSTFSGTHFVAPRTWQAELGFVF